MPVVESTAAAPSATIAALLTMPTVSIAIYLNAIMAFLAIVQTEVIPLWVVLPPNYGGFSMQPTAIASLLMALGPFQMAHQVLLYPRLTARYGSKQLFRYALTGVGVFCALMPFTFHLSRVEASGWLSWAGLVACFIAMVLCRVTSFTCCFVLLNNACTPAIKASANGLAQSAASLAQIVGPVLGGCVVRVECWGGQVAARLRAGVAGAGGGVRAGRVAVRSTARQRRPEGGRSCGQAQELCRG